MFLRGRKFFKAIVLMENSLRMCGIKDHAQWSKIKFMVLSPSSSLS